MLLPEWWLILSGIWFAISILLSLGLIVGGMVAWKKVGPLIGEVQQQVRTVGDKASHIADRAETTVELVQAKTTSILGGVEESSAEITRRLSVAGGAVMTIFVVTRIVGGLKEMTARRHKSAGK